MSQQLVYLAMSGLNATMDRITSSTNNLANASTTAFKAQQPVFQAQPLFGQGLADRVDVATTQDTANFKPGPIETTGRDLDVAVNGPGWIAVQAKDGSTALTRNGSLALSPTGVLQTSDGDPVLGKGGAPISLPPLQKVTIGTDGTISGVAVGQTADQIATLNRIMLVNPPAAALTRRSDGLFADQQGQPVPDASVQLQVGALEGSNANPIETIIGTIETSWLCWTEKGLVRQAVSAGQGENSTMTRT